MIIRFGKHHGESAENVVLRDPQYVMWVMGQTPATGAFARLASEFRRLIERFDERPIVGCCGGYGCERPATCSTIHRGSCIPRWWCGGCDPTAVRNPPGKLIRVRSYLEVCQYAVMYSNGRRADTARLIRAIAQSKGLEDRVGEVEASAFFQENSDE